jgi:hypothetical protein
MKRVSIFICFVLLFSTEALSQSSPCSTTRTITGTAAVCLNQSLIYTTESGMSNYTWTVTGGGGTIMSGHGTNQVTIDWLFAGSSQVRVNYTDAAGCSHFMAMASKAITVTSAVATIFPSHSPSNTFCLNPALPANDPSNVAVYTTQPGQTNYIWNVSAAGTVVSGGGSTHNTVSVAWNTTGAQSVSVSYTTTTGCVSPTVVNNLTVASMDIPTITGTASICSTVGLAPPVPYTTESGKSNYQWSVEGGSIVGASNTNAVSVRWFPDGFGGAKSLAVSYSSASGCQSQTSITVTTLPAESPVLDGLQSVCKGSTHTYTTQPGKTNYVWTIPTPSTLTSGGTSTDNYATVTWSHALTAGLSVKFTNANGCTSSPVSRTISVQDAYVGIDGVSTTACQGQTITYNSLHALQTYAWSVSAGGEVLSGGTSTSNFVQVKWNAAGAQSVSLTGTTVSGCIPVSPAVKSVAVTASPSLAIDGVATACKNIDAFYTLASGYGGYTWSVTGGSVISGQSTNSALIRFSTAGTQTVTGSYMSAGCTWTSQKSVVVNDIPPASITANSTMCQDKEEILTTESGKSNYVWSFSNAVTITDGGNGYDFVKLKWVDSGPLRSVGVAYSNATGCNSSATKNVTVVASAIPTINASSPWGCFGGEVTYTTQAGKSNYIWTVASGGTITAGGTASDNFMTIRWLTVGEHTISVTFTETNGCIPATPTTSLITVLPSPTLSKLDGCVGIQSGYYVQEYYANYSWSVTGGTIIGSSTGSLVQVIWNTLGAQTLSLNYTTTGGCSPATPVVFPISVSGQVAGLEGNPTACQDSSENIYTTESGKSSYQWSVQGGTISSGQGTNSISVQWTHATNGVVNVSYMGAVCRSPVTTLNVSILSKPVISLTGPAQVCRGFSGMYVTDAGKSNYVWTTTPGAIITTVNPSSSNTIDVIWGSGTSSALSVNYTDTNGCRATSAKAISTPTPSSGYRTLTSSPSASGCVNSNVTFSTQTAKTDYVWSIPSGAVLVDGGTASSNFATVSFGTTGDHTVSVDYTDPQSCTHPGVASSTINIKARPVPTLEGDEVVSQNLSYVYTTHAGKSNYTWNVSSGGTITAGGASSDHTATVVWTGTGTQSVSVGYTDDNSCQSASPASKNVTVYQPSYITIPDPAFRTELKYRVGPGCFNASDQMDKNCPAVLNQTIIQVNGLGTISDITGVEHFINVKKIICDYNVITSIPALPPALEEFSAIHNQIASVSGTFPSTLEYLAIDDNRLTGLPALPASLEILTCSNNDLSSLPSLPAGLIGLNVSQNDLTTLPALPSQLTGINCSYNMLTVLPALPSTLVELKCHHNQLTAIPALPLPLITLECNNNLITALPAIPANVKTLFAHLNQITTIASLPSSLDYLNVAGNLLTDMPFSSATEYANLNSNLLDFSDLSLFLGADDFTGVNQRYHLIPASVTVVEGDTLRLNGTINGGSSNKYDWYKDGQFVYRGPDGTTPIFKTKSFVYHTGLYHCVVKNNFFPGIDIISFPVDVKVLRRQTITFNPIGTKTYGNAPFDLVATGSAGGNPIVFTSSDETIATISGTTVTIVGAGTCTMTATREGDSEFGAATATQPLTVNKASQTITFASLAARTVGETFTLTATASSGLPVTYASSNGNATIAGSSATIVAAGSATITASQSGNANYYAATSVQRTQTSYDVPVAVITGPTTLCGTSITLTTNNTRSDYTYLWSTGATTQSITITNAGDYWLTVTNGAGTQATSTTHTVVSAPFDIHITGPTSFCEGTGITLAANTNGVTMASYSWTGTGVQVAHLYQISTGGTYTVTSTDAGGCSRTSQPYVVTAIASLNGGTISKDPHGCLTPENPVATLTPAPSGGNNFQWSSGQTSPTISVTVPGIYYVNYSVSSVPTRGCIYVGYCVERIRTDETDEKDTAPESSELPSTIADVSAYPNPVDNDLSIELPTSPHKQITIRLIHTSGRTMLEETVDNDGTTKHLNVAKLPTGVYLMVLHANRFTVGRRKIMIVH